MRASDVSPDHVRLATPEVELVFPTWYGPRIARFARLGGANVFGEISPDVQGNDTPFGDRWHIYGGHRLWYAPEGDPRSYYPDNAPVHVEARDGAVTLTQRVEPHTQLEKSIDVSLDAATSLVTVTHRLTDAGRAP